MIWDWQHSVILTIDVSCLIGKITSDVCQDPKEELVSKKFIQDIKQDMKHEQKMCHVSRSCPRACQHIANMNDILELGCWHIPMAQL